VIIARAPLRLSLGGGGTDIPAYYRKHGGFCVAAAIDKYVYVALHKNFGRGLILKYSEIERCQTVDEVRHPIIREALRMVDPDSLDLEITSFADIPAGTGLGSSSAFTNALLMALSERFVRDWDKQEIARRACEIEINILKEPIGKQDQWISALGGVRALVFMGEQVLTAHSYEVNPESFSLFYTGVTRRTSDVLPSAPNFTALDFSKATGLATHEALLSGDLKPVAAAMHTHWMAKRTQPNISTPLIDCIYDTALASGAILGGKLIGAGGGGFLLFIPADKPKLVSAMAELGLPQVPFKFDYQGVVIL
jgi:D-glycero-alpha-D-manno-heptose-7-phosphate kinase